MNRFVALLASAPLILAAQDARQARRVMNYYAKRLRPMADSLQAQAAAAKHLQAVDDTTQDALFQAGKALDTRYVR